MGWSRMDTNAALSLELLVSGLGITAPLGWAQTSTFFCYPTYAPKFRQHEVQRRIEVTMKSQPYPGRVTSIELSRFPGNAF